MNTKPSNRYIMRKQGSALLLALLMLVAVSSFTLFILKVTLVSNHAANYEEDSEAAYRMARTGLDEALVTLKTAPAANRFIDIPTKRRGFSKDTSGNKCALLTTLKLTNQSTASKDCPYYDITVRRTITLPLGTSGIVRAGTTENDTGITEAEVILSLSGDTPVLDLAVKPAQAYSNEELADCPDPLSNEQDVSNFGGAICSISVSGTANVSIQSINRYANTGAYRVPMYCSTTCTQHQTKLVIKLRKHASTLKDPALILISPYTNYYYGPSSAGVSGSFVIYKGYTTVEATGYSGNVKRKLIMYIRDNDNDTDTEGTTRDVYEFGREFDTYGCLKDAVKSPGNNIVGDEIIDCPNFTRHIDNGTTVYTEVLQ